MAKDLARKTARLNELERRRLELEAAARMVDLTTTTARVRAIKQEHAQVVAHIARLTRALK